MIWEEVLERLEQEAPGAVMARLSLEQALPSSWIDEIFQTHRHRQYPRELLFSSVVEMMMLVTLGLRPSLHAAARKMKERLPVSLAALYAKVKRTEPGIMRALVQGSSERLRGVVGPIIAEPSLPGWRLRVLDGNHLPGSEKRLAPLREHRGAALPGHTLVVYDPDSGLVCDMVACEDAHAQERSAMRPLLDSAQEGELWIADRNFCTREILQGWQVAGASFIVREHACHPKRVDIGPLQACGRVETGQVYEQPIEIKENQVPWRRIELHLDTPTEAGDKAIALWSNLPPQISALQIAQLYRKRWCIEAMFQRLESVLHSEIHSLGHPRAALLGFTVAVLAYNVLALLKRLTEHAHRSTHPQLDVSTYHLAVEITSSYEAMMLMLPSEHLPCADNDPKALLHRLLVLAKRLSPKQLVTSKRTPKKDKPKGYIDGKLARTHVSTARVLKRAAGGRR